MTRSASRWVVGGTIGALGLALGYGILHSRTRPLGLLGSRPSSRGRGEYGPSREEHDHEKHKHGHHHHEES